MPVILPAAVPVPVPAPTDRLSAQAPYVDLLAQISPSWPYVDVGREMMLVPRQVNGQWWSDTDSDTTTTAETTATVTTTSDCLTTAVAESQQLTTTVVTEDCDCSSTIFPGPYYTATQESAAPSPTGISTVSPNNSLVPNHTQSVTIGVAVAYIFIM
jgi:hypothetical protein